MNERKITTFDKICIFLAFAYLAILVVQIYEGRKTMVINMAYNEVISFYAETCFKDVLRFPK